MTGYPSHSPDKGNNPPPQLRGPPSKNKQRAAPSLLWGSDRPNWGQTGSGAGPTKLGVPPPPHARRRAVNPGPATEGGRHGHTPRSGRGWESRTGTRGPAPCPWGPAPTSSAAPYSSRPPLLSNPQRRRCAPPPRFPRRSRSSRPLSRVRRLRRAPRRTGLEWSSRPPRAPRTPAPPAGRVPPTEGPSGTRWPPRSCPPGTGRPPPRGVTGIPEVRSPHPG